MMINNERFTTPKGYANYPCLKTPDTRFNPEGDYKVNLHLEDTPETQALLTKLKGIIEDFYDNSDDVKQAIAKGRKVTIQDFYENDEEGRIVLKFKQKAVITKRDGSKLEIKVRQFDSKGKPMDEDIGRDSVIKVAFTVLPYYMPATRICGLSLRPVAVQVIELNKNGGASAESFGFGEEDGYQAEAKTESWEDLEDDFNKDF